jgi:dTMP kinase
MPIGKLIALEGGDGSGKRTVSQRLKDAVDHTEQFYFVREPGGTRLGDKIRSVLLDTEVTTVPVEELLLFMASRLALFREVVRPKLLQGIHVVTDRLDASSYAYQLYARDELGLEDMFRHIRRRYVLPLDPGVTDWLHPYYIFLDLPPEVGLKRKCQVGLQNHFDTRELEFHQKVREGYLHFVRGERHYKVIDASRSLDDVYEEVRVSISQITGIEIPCLQTVADTPK